jgi:hypothetical protein
VPRPGLASLLLSLTYPLLFLSLSPSPSVNNCWWWFIQLLLFCAQQRLCSASRRLDGDSIENAAQPWPTYHT